MVRTDDIHNTQRIANAAEAFIQALGAHLPEQTFAQLFSRRSLRRAYWTALQETLARYSTPATTSLARALLRGEVLADGALNEQLLQHLLFDESPDYGYLAACWQTVLDGEGGEDEVAAEAERFFDLLASELRRQGEVRVALQRVARTHDVPDHDTTVSAQQDLSQLLDTALTSGPRTLLLQVRHVRSLAAQTKPSAPGLTTDRLLALADLGAHVDAAALQAVWQTASGLADPVVQLRVVAQLAPHLARAGLVENALDVVRAAGEATAIPSEVRADVLLTLAPRLGSPAGSGQMPSLLQRVLGGMQGIVDPASRVRALGALIENLPQELQSQAVFQALEAAASIPNDMARATALSVLPPHLPPEFQGRQLSLAFDLREPEARALLLGRMIPSLPATLQSAALTASLDAVEHISGDDARAAALMALAPYIGAVAPLGQMPQELQQALRAVLSIVRKDDRARAFAALAPYLSPDLLVEALHALRSITDDEERALTLTQLAPHLTPDLQVAAFASAHELALPQARAVALATVAPYLEPEARTQALADALDAALAVEEPYQRVMSLVELTPYLVEEQRRQVLSAAIQAAQAIADQAGRARALVFLAPHLTESLLEHALAEAYAIRDPLVRVSALAALMPHLGAHHQTRAAGDIIGWARTMRPPHHRASLLASIALVVPDDLIPEVIAAAERIETPYDRLHVLAALLPRQPEHLGDRALEAAQAIPNRYQRANALLELVPHAVHNQRHIIVDQALVTALGIEDDYDRASALAHLAQHVGTQPADRARQQEGLELALDACLLVADRALRATLLARHATLWVMLLTPGQSYRLWRRLVMVLRTCSEAEVVSTLAALSPVLDHMGAPGASLEMAEALRAATFDT